MYDAVCYARDAEQWLPVYADRALEMGAISVVVQCPEGLEVLDVRSVLSHEDLLWNYQGGELRLGWSNVAGKALKQGEPLFELKVKGHAERPWQMKDLSEIADLNAEPLDMVQLRIPKVLAQSQGWHVALFPNPAHNEAYFDFELPAGTGLVRMELLDSRGRIVWEDKLSSPSPGRLRHEIPAQIGTDLELYHQTLSLVIRR